MLRDKRHVFWQAFLITLIIFSLGIVFGVYIEQNRSDEANALFFNSESSLFDTLALTSLLDNSNFSCEELVSAQITFADKIYSEAKTIEEYEDSSKLTISLKAVHKKYDLLRTILWINSIKIREKCPNVNNVIYLYQYSTENVETKSAQNVWSKVLSDLKNKQANNIILIPIAVDNDISSLDTILKPYNIQAYPVVIINEKHVISEESSVEELEKYLN